MDSPRVEKVNNLLEPIYSYIIPVKIPVVASAMEYEASIMLWNSGET